MKRLRLRFQRNTRRRILLWLPCLLFCGWSLTYLARERQAERERALYDGRSIHEWLDQALAESYYSCHWATLGDPEGGKFDQQVIAIGAPAVPELVRRLRGLRTGALHYKLILLRSRLGVSSKFCPKYFDPPDDVSGKVAHINYLLSKMGDAARPAVPAMLESASVLHAWGYYDLLADFVRMGPAARGTLPRLREWAQAGDQDAALAVRFIERGKTEINYSDIEQDETASGHK